MSKGNTLERIIYIAIMAIFLIVLAFPIMHMPMGNDIVSINAYTMIFTNNDLAIFGNIFLALPIVSSLAAIVLNIVELSMKKIDFSIEYAIVFFYMFIMAFGLMFASLSNNMFPYGMIIIGVTFALVLVRVIFHYGVRKQKI